MFPSVNWMQTKQVECDTTTPDSRMNLTQESYQTLVLEEMTRWEDKVLDCPVVSQKHRLEGVIDSSRVRSSPPAVLRLTSRGNLPPEGIACPLEVDYLRPSKLDRFSPHSGGVLNDLTEEPIPLPWGLRASVFLWAYVRSAFRALPHAQGRRG